MSFSSFLIFTLYETGRVIYSNLLVLVYLFNNPGISTVQIIVSRQSAVSILPFQRTLFYYIYKATKEESYKHQYRPKTAPAKLLKVHGIRIKKDHFNVKQHKQYRRQEIFYRHRLTCIAMCFYSTGKSLQFIRRFSFWP